MKTLGIGGAFIRVKDLEKMQAWYHEVLKIEFQDWHGAVFLGTPKSCTIFSFFSETSDYFPKEQQVMLNFQTINTYVYTIANEAAMGIPTLEVWFWNYGR